MTAEKPAMAFGRYLYGLGVMAIGLASLIFGEFDPGQPVPAGFPARTALVYVAGAFLVLAAAVVQWRRIAAFGAVALAAYYALLVIILMNGSILLTQYATYGIYEELAMQLALAAAGMIVFANTAKIASALAARLTLFARLAFGLCALVWGGAHFVYMNLTAPLVPKWLPPTQEFWGYLTGAAFIAAGLAILTGLQARLAAILLTAMIVTFGVLVNGRILLADTTSHFNWTESALNLALIGAAWVVADSLARSVPQ